MNKKLFNTQIEALNTAHGAEIIAFYKEQGFNTWGLEGTVTLENQNNCRFYGVNYEGDFDNRQKNKRLNIKTITLAEAQEMVTTSIEVNKKDMINFFNELCEKLKISKEELLGNLTKDEPEYKRGDLVMITDMNGYEGNIFSLNKVYKLGGEFFDKNKINFAVEKDDKGYENGVVSIEFRHATDEEKLTYNFPKDGQLCFVRNEINHVWQLRYSNGKGKFYFKQKKNGDNLSYYEYRAICNCELPETI